MYKLRSYQSDAVKAVIHYFRQHTTPALIVLPTGAGKSLVIAELARLAKGKVLVLAHVKGLVEQNHEKYEAYGVTGGIFSASLGKKQTEQQVIFASVQSVVRNLDAFQNQFSLLVIDECHRVPMNKNSSYRKVISKLQLVNPDVKILGLTATPYRLGMGWIYKYHTRGLVRSEQETFFSDCIFELPIRYLLDEGYLTPPRMIDAPLLSYDFSQLKPASTGYYIASELDMVIDKAQRATPQIVKQIVQYAETKQGVMIFAATVRHAQEVLSLLSEQLPDGQCVLVTGETPISERTEIIQRFKQREIKFLVNVSVLTTGFDAPHVDLIAVLRPTESLSLYQQIVGRGLRLSDNKKECLVLDYAGNQYDIYQPEMGEDKPDSDSEIITIPCPACGFNNNFWGKLDDNGILLEHYGRKCQGYMEDDDGEREHCDYRFKAKFCSECGADNDIAARICHQCQTTLVDADKKLKEALQLKDAMIFGCEDLLLSREVTQTKQTQIKVTYVGTEGQQVHQWWMYQTKKQKQTFFSQFIQPHLADRHRPFTVTAASKIVEEQHRFRLPEFVIAYKQGRFWHVRDVVFADELTLEERGSVTLREVAGSG